MSNLLDAPCVFCGYNSNNYWQPRSHTTTCPWYHVGGTEIREKLLRKTVEDLAVKESK